MKNKHDTKIDFFSNDDVGISLKEFLICEANAFAEKNGFSSVKGMSQWLSSEMIASIGDFLIRGSEKGRDLNFRDADGRLKRSFQESDARKVMAGERTPIDKGAVFAKYFYQVVKNAPIFLEDNHTAQIRSLEDLGLSQNNGIKVDENGNFIITVSDNVQGTQANIDNNAQIYSSQTPYEIAAQNKGETTYMDDNLNKYEEIYRNNLHAFKSDLDSFFEENSEKLKKDEGKAELCEELMRKPLRRIENIQERKAYSKCFVDDYSKNMQNNKDSFTRTGCEMIASKYTVEQIEKNPNLHAFENGKITKDYAEFVKNNSEYVKERDQNLVNSVNAQGRDLSFKEMATHNANRQIQRNFDVGSYREKSITVEQSNER